MIIEKEKRSTADSGTITLADLPNGACATILKVLPSSNGGRKFADIGLIGGAGVKVQARAPFGGLMRVKVMDASFALHETDARCVILKGI